MMVNKLIEQLRSITNSPKESIQKACSKTGKRAVGCVAPYAPEEIVYAAGCLPVGIWGGQVELKRVRKYLPPFACSIMQSIVEMELDGTYDELAAVIFPSPCDTLKCIGQTYRGKSPCIHFAHPMNRREAYANTYLVSEYNMIRRKLEEILSTTITEEALRDSIILYNEYRRAMRTFVAVAANHLDLITPRVRHEIIKASYFMDKADYISLIQKLTNELRRRNPTAFEGKRMVLTGITFEPTELLDILEFYKIGVVADDLAQESRQFRTDAPYYGGAMESLAKMWQVHDGCSLAFDPFKSRAQMLVEMVRAANADGLIVGLMKFCDPEEYDVPILMTACEEAGIPMLVVEIDQQTTACEQVRTRIQGFVESL